MCTPALLLGIGGAVVKGISAFSGMQTQAANYRTQKAAAERDAASRREQGAYEGARAYERGSQLIGRQIAGYGGRGISPSSGTALDTITSTGGDVGLDIAASRFGTARAIENDNYRAKVAGMNASASSAAAPFAFIAPILEGGATYLKGQYA
jgi:hypothetical protein